MIIAGFHPLSLCDFPETPAAVLFSQGCNWQCRYCHNRTLIPRRSAEKSLDFEVILNLIKTRLKLLKGVVFTGGEPTIHKDLQRYMVPMKRLGLKVKLDSNGSDPQTLRRLIESGIVDYVAMDIKAPFEKYETITGLPVRPEVVKESIRIIASSGIGHQFRTTWPRDLLTADDIKQIRELLPSNSEYVVQECRK